jgi:hypothetical protein
MREEEWKKLEEMEKFARAQERVSPSQEELTQND